MAFSSKMIDLSEYLSFANSCQASAINLNHSFSLQECIQVKIILSERFDCSQNIPNIINNYLSSPCEELFLSISDILSGESQVQCTKWSFERAFKPLLEYCVEGHAAVENNVDRVFRGWADLLTKGFGDNYMEYLKLFNLRGILGKNEKSSLTYPARQLFRDLGVFFPSQANEIEHRASTAYKFDLSLEENFNVFSETLGSQLLDASVLMSFQFLFYNRFRAGPVLEKGVLLESLIPANEALVSLFEPHVIELESKLIGDKLRDAEKTNEWWNYLFFDGAESLSLVAVRNFMRRALHSIVVEVVKSGDLSKQKLLIDHFLNLLTPLQEMLKGTHRLIERHDVDTHKAVALVLKSTHTLAALQARIVTEAVDDKTLQDSLLIAVDVRTTLASLAAYFVLPQANKISIVHYPLSPIPLETDETRHVEEFF
eukprot:GDKJ01025327.1.p1 GENE.GDKJ01025327.1~~GDKJ01025327.1.p1  ORF type:complete len:428 (-),score=76.66 GDKJ01025327.1:259-1542(-)